MRQSLLHLLLSFGVRTPMAGDIANVVRESKAREVAEYRSRKLKEKEAALSSRGSVEQMLANISQVMS